MYYYQAAFVGTREQVINDLTSHVPLHKGDFVEAYGEQWEVRRVQHYTELVVDQGHGTLIPKEKPVLMLWRETK